MSKKKYQSKLAGVVHRTAEGLHRAGALDKTTMREFDAMCLTPLKPLSQLRSKEFGWRTTSARLSSRLI